MRPKTVSRMYTRISIPHQIRLSIPITRQTATGKYLYSARVCPDRHTRRSDDPQYDHKPDLTPGKYLISVLADEFKIDGQWFTIPDGGHPPRVQRGPHQPGHATVAVAQRYHPHQGVRGQILPSTARQTSRQSTAWQDLLPISPMCWVKQPLMYTATPCVRFTRPT